MCFAHAVTSLSNYQDIYFKIVNKAYFASQLGHFVKWKHTYLTLVAYFQMAYPWGNVAHSTEIG